MENEILVEKTGLIPAVQRRLAEKARLGTASCVDLGDMFEIIYHFEPQAKPEPLRHIRVKIAKGDTLPAYPICILLLWPLGHRSVNATWSAWLRDTVTPSIPPAVAGAALWLLVHWLVRPASWMGLAGCTAIGFAGYVGVLLVFCLQKHEREDLRYVFDRIVRARRSPAPSQFNAESRNIYNEDISY